MRITNSLQYSSLQGNIETSLENLNGVQRQISTGKKLTTFSDDASGASQSLALRSTLDDNKQYQRDVDQANSFLSAGDSALGSASDILRSARQLAVQGANSLQSPDQGAALSAQVDGMISQLTQIANSSLHGKYLFGGTQTNTPPYDAAQTYQGNNAPLTAEIGTSYSLQINTVGSTAFGPAFAALKNLKANLASGSPTAITTDIGQVDAALTTLTGARAGIGAKVAEVNGVKSRLTQAQGEYEDAVSSIEDVDLATAYVQLQSAQNIYQASLSTTAKAFQYSLADYLH